MVSAAALAAVEALSNRVDALLGGVAGAMPTNVLLAHPASCAYGLNLQHGGHHIIWYGLTWSLEQYMQANARLHRQGQDRPVIVHRLLVQGGVDEDVVAALEGKYDAQDALMIALKAKIREMRAVA